MAVAPIFDNRLIFEKSRPGAAAIHLPEPDGAPLDKLIPAKYLRTEAPRLPEVGEFEVVRHYTNLSRKIFSIDTHFYPLGSCTMKYNPRINEKVASMAGFAAVHPHQPVEQAQGTLHIMFELEKYLAEIGGMDAVSLQPAAGAQGELTGILVIKAYLVANGQAARTEILIPDSAHGTNPATASVAGLKTVTVKSDARGGVDLNDLKAKLSERTAAIMITNPTTLGLFEDQIVEIADLVHRAGGQVYMDGANMNAIQGIARPGDFGVDVMHYNLHKTFSTPHGGGGPGSGPIAVRKHLEPFLPVPRIVKKAETIEFDYNQPKSIGRVKAFFGNAGMWYRAYTYIRFHGPDGIRRNAENAVLNANYLRAKLRKDYHVAYDRTCMHEVVLDGTPFKKYGVRTLDIAKRLLDYGHHAPTIYFPLIVHEAIMIEPTETETKDALDAFVDAMLKIKDEAKKNPKLLTDAPHTMPVKRLDEVRAAKQPMLCCTLDARSEPEKQPKAKPAKSKA